MSEDPNSAGEHESQNRAGRGRSRRLVARACGHGKRFAAVLVAAANPYRGWILGVVVGAVFSGAGEVLGRVMVGLWLLLTAALGVAAAGLGLSVARQAGRVAWRRLRSVEQVGPSVDLAPMGPTTALFRIWYRVTCSTIVLAPHAVGSALSLVPGSREIIVRIAIALVCLVVVGLGGVVVALACSLLVQVAQAVWRACSLLVQVARAGWRRLAKPR